jgi:hypothetical protein
MHFYPTLSAERERSPARYPKARQMRRGFVGLPSGRGLVFNVPGRAALEWQLRKDELCPTTR